MLIEGQAIWNESRQLVLYSHREKCAISYVNSSEGGKLKYKKIREKERNALPPPLAFFLQTQGKVHLVFAQFSALGQTWAPHCAILATYNVDAKPLLRSRIRFLVTSTEPWSPPWRKAELRGRSSPFLRGQRTLSMQLFEDRIGIYFLCISNVF